MTQEELQIMVVAIRKYVDRKMVAATGLTANGTQRLTLPQQVIDLPAPVVNVASPRVDVHPTPIHVEPAPSIITNEVHPSPVPVVVNVDLSGIEGIFRGMAVIHTQLLAKLAELLTLLAEPRPLVPFRLEEGEDGIKRAIPDTDTPNV